MLNERDLRDVYRENHVLLDYISSGILVIDKNYTIVYMNPMCEKLLRISMIESIKQNIYTLYPEAPDDVRYLEKTIQYGKPFEIDEYSYKFGPFDQYFKIKTNIIEENGEVTGAIAEFSDITEYVIQKNKFKRSLEEMASTIIMLPHQKGILPLNQAIIDHLEIKDIAEKVLSTVTKSNLSILIVDMSAIFEPNAHFFQSVGSLVSALNLLGVQVAISGINPALALHMATSGFKVQNKIKFYNSMLYAL